MSQFALTSEERIDALVGFGYTEREAAFLCLTALHGGHFLRRQYCRFLKREVGGTAAALIEKALAKDHIIASTYGRNTHVYRLGARPFYAALGQEDNRNRRARQALAVKNRLMSLDFVLDHPEHSYLATEQEKLGYFTGTLPIEFSSLPAKLYRSPKTGAATTRYFVDKYPIFLSGAPAVAAFCFVDEGAASLSGFETYLEQYSRLFEALSRFDLIYVAASRAFFQPAAQRFDRFLADARGRLRGGPMDPLIRRMLDHFEARHLFETQQLSSFDRAKLIRLREEQKEFSGPKYDAIYERWKEGGETTVLKNLGMEAPVQVPISGRFSTYLLEHDYGFFGSLTAS